MTNKKIYLVAADMGYGHQRAAYPLMDISGGEIITINDYEGIDLWEKKYWIKSLRSYEKISRLKKIPLLGYFIFLMLDAFQRIYPLYPHRDLSSPSVQQKYFFQFVKRGLGKNLINKLNKQPLPFVTTFFVAAYIAEYNNYQGDIYCIICDTDASRSWAPLSPKTSRTKFLVPSDKVKERFLMYGVKEENIIVTGFPLPKENIGQGKETLLADLSRRVSVLDQKGIYRHQYSPLLQTDLPDSFKDARRPVVVAFAVGGAGAQKEVSGVIINRLSSLIKEKKVALNLIAGNRLEIKKYFEDTIKAAGLELGKGINIIYSPSKIEYFKLFNISLHQTDILWTKPSELSFYCALGLPIIMSSPVGSQEDWNRDWLLSVGAGIDSLDPAYVDEWLPDLLESGRLARTAIDGYLNAETMGTYNIQRLLDGINS